MIKGGRSRSGRCGSVRREARGENNNTQHCSSLVAFTFTASRFTTATSILPWEHDISHLFITRKGEEVFDSDESYVSFDDSSESDYSYRNAILRIKELEKINKGLKSQNKSLKELAVENEETIKKLLNRVKECDQKALIERNKLSKLEEVVLNLQTERDEILISSRDEVERKNASLASLQTQNAALQEEKCGLTQKLRDCQEELQYLQASYEACLTQINESDKIICSLQNDQNSEITEYKSRIQYLEEKVANLQAKLENCAQNYDVQMNGHLSYILSNGVVAQCIQFTALLISMCEKCARRSLNRSNSVIGVKQETEKNYFESQSRLPQGNSLAIELMQEKDCHHTRSFSKPVTKERQTFQKSQKQEFSLSRSADLDF
ncbi:Hypothetical predicted protein [Cloeon dipterum]|uniref:Uncharacterized protein n=1 Tax=Cloeon dipterum TaxID=197152 RepID=A0A8S1BWA1_9INSE|nr:Hypothetical predicted protein [Cloeon dipterum]